MGMGLCLELVAFCEIGCLKGDGVDYVVPVSATGRSSRIAEV